MPRGAGWARNLALPAGIALVAGFAAWILVSARTGAWGPEIPNLSWGIERIRAVIERHPISLPLLFAGSHILVSFLSLPGCTLLNLMAGAGFGFWKGVLIVYPATMMSAALGHLAGRAIGERVMPRLPERLKSVIARASERLGSASLSGSEGFLFLVGLRLSPLFPFGVLNLAMGMVRVPLPTYLLSTFVGIFFDVFLLNLIGSQLGLRLGPGLAGAAAPELKELLSLALGFAALVGASIWLRGFLSARSKNL